MNRADPLPDVVARVQVYTTQLGRMQPAETYPHTDVVDAICQAADLATEPGTLEVIIKTPLGAVARVTRDGFERVGF